MKALVLAALIAPFAAASPAINFSTDCETDTIVESGTSLTAYCKDITGEYICSTLDLNTCIENYYGALEADSSGVGGFGESCINCSNAATTSGIIEDDPTLLHCQCNPGTGVSESSWPTSFIDLNTLVDNLNGYLTCNDVVATLCTSSSSTSTADISIGSASSTLTAGKRAEDLHV